MQVFSYKGRSVECTAQSQKRSKVETYGFLGRIIFASDQAYPSPWVFDSAAGESYTTPELAELACYERGKEIIDSEGWGGH
ncbi:hypothetical protein SAMN05192544_11044 [Paraburkholderia hospita]|jgi:hypothetical protein|uniref:Uncharacterized protein n=1 Tax=Paraburkholderia hospita TaxID=169430 RepID=A0AAN1J7C4_9BURK|nr:hypothetical protein C2L64_09685 [Paraburkholderia hospita]SEI27995.1 hypothetical protein SAMN05192544_11044 [Paraburkholderia hospita]